MNEFESLQRQVRELTSENYKLHEEINEKDKKITFLQKTVNELSDKVFYFEMYDSFNMKEQGW